MNVIKTLFDIHFNLQEVIQPFIDYTNSCSRTKSIHTMAVELSFLLKIDNQWMYISYPINSFYYSLCDFYSLVSSLVDFDEVEEATPYDVEWNADSEFTFFLLLNEIDPYLEKEIIITIINNFLQDMEPHKDKNLSNWV